MADAKDEEGEVEVEGRKKECGPCQPCGCCRISLRAGSIVTSAFYIIIGLALTAVSLLDLVYLILDGNRTVMYILALALVSAASILWLLLSIMLFAGAVKKSKCLVHTFVIGILFAHIIFLIVFIFALCVSTEDWYIFYFGYGGILWLLLEWYFYWVAYAYYIELSGRCCCKC